MPTLTIGDRTARLPIVQGGMAVRISLSPLATAVAQAGGVGIIAGSGLSVSEFRDEMRRAREAAHPLWPRLGPPAPEPRAMDSSPRAQASR